MRTLRAQLLPVNAIKLDLGKSRMPSRSNDAAERARVIVDNRTETAKEVTLAQ